MLNEAVRQVTGQKRWRYVCKCPSLSAPYEEIASSKMSSPWRRISYIHTDILFLKVSQLQNKITFIMNTLLRKSLKETEKDSEPSSTVLADNTGSFFYYNMVCILPLSSEHHLV
jgi:hypothetical protein